MSKTLIFNGSPRKKGETVYLIEELIKNLAGEVKVLNAYDCNIRPCIDCRGCFGHKGCNLQDEMQEVYKYIETCDHIILAAPIYFGEISGQLLAILSRLQTYFSAKYIRKEEPFPKEKTGGIILTAGSFGPKEKGEDTSRFILEQMNTVSCRTVYADNTDRVPVRDNQEALNGIAALAKELNNNK